MKSDVSTSLEELVDLDLGLNEQTQDLNSSGIATMIDMLLKPTTKDSVRHGNLEILEKYQTKKFQTLICSVLDFLAKHSQLLEEGKGSVIPGELCFLKLQEYLKLKDLHIFCLKTSKVYSVMTWGKLSLESYERLMSWGIMLHGFVLTANFMEYPRTENVSLLLDILEKKADKRYYLSEKTILALENYKIRKREQGTGFGYQKKTKDDIASTLSQRYYKDGSENIIEEKE